QGKCYGSKSAVGDSRLPTSGAPPLSHLPGFADAAGVETGAAQKRGLLWGPLCDAPRSLPRNAAHLGDPSVRQAAPCAPLLMIDPGDLIARALIIFAEEAEAWRTRRGLDLTPRSAR